MPKPLRQFNFGRYWKRRCSPRLQDPEVQAALDHGMTRLVAQMNTGTKQDPGDYEAAIGPCCSERKSWLRCDTHQKVTWASGDSPAILSWSYEGGLYKRTKDPTKLSFYQPVGRCHFIVDFVQALAKKIYPEHEWLIHYGVKHSVVVSPDLGLVMDILLFKVNTAEESIASASEEGYERLREPY